MNRDIKFVSFKINPFTILVSLLTIQAETSSSKQTVTSVLALGIDSLGILPLNALAAHWVWLRVEGPLIGRSPLL